MAHDILPPAGDPPVLSPSVQLIRATRLAALSGKLLELRRQTVLVQREIDRLTREIGVQP